MSLAVPTSCGQCLRAVLFTMRECSDQKLPSLCNVCVGSKTEVVLLEQHVRSTPRTRHRQATPTCPFRAKKRQGQVDDYIAKLTDVTLSPENGGRLPCLIVAFTDA